MVLGLQANVLTSIGPLVQSTVVPYFKRNGPLQLATLSLNLVSRSLTVCGYGLGCIVVLDRTILHEDLKLDIIANPPSQSQDIMSDKSPGSRALLSPQRSQLDTR